MQHTAQQVLRRLDAITRGPQRIQVTLDRGDTAWDPSSTSRVLHGPGTVTYQRFPDGGVTAHENLRATA